MLIAVLFYGYHFYFRHNFCRYFNVWN